MGVTVSSAAAREKRMERHVLRIQASLIASATEAKASAPTGAALRTSHAQHEDNPRCLLPRRGRGGRRHRRRRGAATWPDNLAAVSVHCAGRDIAEFHAERA